jgi:competence protein ComEC
MAQRSQQCARGQSWEWDAVGFTVLHPSTDSYNDLRIPDNDRSCVLRISSAHGTVLIPGDIGTRSELALLRDAGNELAAEVLVAPHHGSRSSSSAAFTAAVAPRHVVFSAGRFNRHGHPHPQVVARYRSLGARAYRTDVGGAVSVRVGAEGIRVSEWRTRASRFWYAQ